MAFQGPLLILDRLWRAAHIHVLIDLEDLLAIHIRHILQLLPHFGVAQFIACLRDLKQCRERASFDVLSVEVCAFG